MRGLWHPSSSLEIDTDLRNDCVLGIGDLDCDRDSARRGGGDGGKKEMGERGVARSIDISPSQLLSRSSVFGV